MNSKTREKIARAANGEIDGEMVHLVKENFQAVGTRENGEDSWPSDEKLSN